MADQKMNWELITHKWAHFDEDLGMFLLVTFGEELFPGISRATVDYVDAGSRAPDHLIGKIWTEVKIAAVGVWGKKYGPFDEHRMGDEIREHGECAASLVLKYLKQHIPDFNYPLIEAAVAYATSIDLNGRADKDSMPNLVKLMNTMRPDDPEKTLKWAFTGIRTYLEHGDPEHATFDIGAIAKLMPEDEGNAWLKPANEALMWAQDRRNEAVTEWKEKKQIFHFTDNRGGKRSIGFMESDNSTMANVILTFGKMAIAIVKKSSGHVVILSNKKWGIDTTGLARVLNLTEQELRGDVRITTFGDLSREGTMPGGCWYFSQAMSLLNGSQSAQSVEPTWITNIVELAVLALDEARFSTEAEGCACDRKTCQKSACWMYKYGLIRCTEIAKENLRAKLKEATEPSPGNHPFASLRRLLDQML
jgi:hypothetical protein